MIQQEFINNAGQLWDSMRLSSRIDVLNKYAPINWSESAISKYADMSWKNFSSVMQFRMYNILKRNMSSLRNRNQ